MTHNNHMKYVFQDYDNILIIASWGMPKSYKQSRYVLETEVIRDSEEKRSIVKGINNAKYHSSTVAIRDLLWKKINVSRKRIGLLIFCQDTILIDYVGKKGFWTNLLKAKELRRSDLKKYMISKLYDQKREVAEELGVKEAKDYESFVRFVPGVITRVKEAYLYTWRSEQCYDLLLGSIILHTYKKLKQVPRDTTKIAILLDTTHGINYFVTALKEGVLRATTLYAFNRFVENINNGHIKALEKLIVYHYNSDPLSPESEGTPSLKIHLLDKIAIVKNKQILLNNIFATIEERISREGLNGLSKRLGEVWESVEWRKVLESLLLFSRGLLVWALRATFNISNVPDINDLEESLNKLKLEFSSEKTEYKVSYRLTNRNPMMQVVEYAILLNSLKTLANKVACTNDIYTEGFEIMDDISKKLSTELINVGLYDEIQSIVKNKDRRSEYICFSLEKLEKIAKLIYTSPYRDIIINEIKNIKEYLTSKEIKWNKISKHVYAESYKRPAYVIEYNDMRMLISKLGSIDERKVYAHAGLAYGLPWFALNLKEKGVILYLGSPDRVIDILHTTLRK